MGATILAVEDTPANLDLMTYLLEAHGHRVVAAATGTQGLALGHERPPDIVVLDVQLPDIDGYEVLSRWRADPELPGVPIIAVTAYAMVGDRDHALAAGFDGYVSKPIEPATFATTIDGYLPADLRGREPDPARRAGTAPADGTRASSADPAAFGPPRAKVLAVDDNPVNLELMCSVLRPHGFEVATARCVGEAIELVRTNRPDVVLTDFHLGEETGIDLLVYLRADPGLADIPVALMTSTGASVEPLARSYSVQVILGPLDPRRLVSEVQTALGR